MIRRDVIASLQYRNRALEKENENFRNGSIYKKMMIGQKRMRHYYEKQLKQYKKKLAALEKEKYAVLDMWFQVFQDVQDDCTKKLAAMDARIEEMIGKLQKLQAKLRQRNRELVDTRAMVQDEKEKNRN